jgi:hypothetical protein
MYGEQNIQGILQARPQGQLPGGSATSADNGSISYPYVNRVPNTSWPWAYPYYPYALPTYTPPLPESYRLAVEILALGTKCPPALRKKAETVLAKGLG